MRKKTINSISKLTGLITIICAFSGYVSPKFGVIFSFFSLVFPLMLFIQLFFLLTAILNARIKSIAWSLLVILICWPVITDYFAFNSPINKSSKKGIHIMSWNVRLFDLYNWSNNTQTKSKMFNFLKKQQPDILAFQEFYHQTIADPLFVTRDSLITFLKAKNYHEMYPNVVRGSHFFGLATFTKYPILSKGDIQFSDSTTNVCLFTDLLMNKDTVRVFNAHLASIRFSSDDYKFMETYSENLAGEKPSIKEGGLKIINRLLKAYKKRAKQALIIEQAIKESPYPVIVMGDFNDSPTSFTYRCMKGELTDSFLEKGYGIGGSYNRLWSMFRIDYLFVDPTLYRVNSYQRHKVNYSDHYPVSSWIEKIKS